MRRMRRLRPFGAGAEPSRPGRRPRGGSSSSPPRPGRAGRGDTAVPDRPPLAIAEREVAAVAVGAIARVAVPVPLRLPVRPLSWVSSRGSRVWPAPSGGVTVPTALRRVAPTASVLVTVGSSKAEWWVGFCDGGTGRQPAGRAPSGAGGGGGPAGRPCPPLRGPGEPCGGRGGPGGGPGGPCAVRGGPGGAPRASPRPSPRAGGPGGVAPGLARSAPGGRAPPRSVRRSSSTDRLPVPGGSLRTVRARRSGGAGGPLPTRRRFPRRMTVRGGSTGTTGRPPRRAR